MTLRTNGLRGPACLVEEHWETAKEKIENTHEVVISLKEDLGYLKDIAQQLGLVHEEAKLMRESLVGPATGPTKTVAWLVGGVVATLGVLLVVLILKDSPKDFGVGGENGVRFTTPKH